MQDQNERTCSSREVKEYKTCIHAHLEAEILSHVLFKHYMFLQMRTEIQGSYAGLRVFTAVCTAG